MFTIYSSSLVFFQQSIKHFFRIKLSITVVQDVGSYIYKKNLNTIIISKYLKSD